jgi:hypothetical protein
LRRPLARGELIVVAALFLLLGTAPTVGDVGGCGVTPTDLDLTAFAQARKNLDCQRCQECGLVLLVDGGGASGNSTCIGACQETGSLVYPASCHPLQHDGDVCLRALQVASCSDYESFVDPVAPTTPTECDFCHGIDGGAAGGDP